MSSKTEAHGFVVTALLALLLCGMVCEAYRGLLPPDPENPSKCIYRGDVLKVGVNVGFGPCQRLTCHEDGSILVEGCGKVRIENCNAGYRINQNETYPLCCKLMYKCRNADGSVYFMEKDVSEGDVKAENSA